MTGRSFGRAEATALPPQLRKDTLCAAGAECLAPERGLNFRVGTKPRLREDPVDREMRRNERSTQNSLEGSGRGGAGVHAA